MPCCLQRGTNRQEQKAQEAGRRASAMLQFQEDRDRRRLQDESAQVSAQLAAQAAEQASTLATIQSQAAMMQWMCISRRLPSQGRFPWHLINKLLPTGPAQTLPDTAVLHLRST